MVMRDTGLYRADDNKIVDSLMSAGHGRKQGLKKCFYPLAVPCTNQAISAHYISRQLVLTQIAEDSKVVVVRNSTDFNHRSLHVEGRVQGIKETAIFSGLCDQHDKKFLRVDQNLLTDYNNHEVMFWLVFRLAIAHKWLNMDKIHRFQQFDARLGYPANALFPDLPLHRLDDYVVNDIAILLHLNKLRQKRNWAGVKHISIEIDMDAVVAASFTISFLDNPRVLRPLLHVFVNIFPVSAQKTLVVISTLANQFKLLSSWFADFRVGTNDHKQDWLHHLLKMSTGHGLAFRPSYWESSHDKQQLLQRLNAQFLGHEHEILFSPR